MPLPGLPPEQCRIRDFFEELPHCPHGCDNSSVYDTPTFRAPTPDDTIDGQVREIIARYEREAAAMMVRHFREMHPVDWPVLAKAVEAKTKFEASMRCLAEQTAAAPDEVQRLREAVLAMGRVQP